MKRHALRQSRVLFPATTVSVLAAAPIRAEAIAVAEKFGGRMPTSAQAGVYTSALHDLNAIRDAPKGMAQMHATPVDEAFRPLKDGGGPLVK